MNKQNITKRKNLIMGGLLGLVFVMTIAYATFASNLNITGTSNITNNWNIFIKSISPTEETAIKSGDKYTKAGNIEAKKTSDLSASFNAVLVYPGDSVTYDIVLRNEGSLDAYLKEINKTINTNEEYIKVSFGGFAKGQVLQKNSEQTLTVTVEFLNKEYSSLTEQITANISLNFEFSQQATNEEGISPTKHLVQYDCNTNGGKECTDFNEYLENGNTVNLENKGTGKGKLKFIGWNTDKDATTGLESLSMGDNDITLYAIYKESQPIIKSYNWDEDNYETDFQSLGRNVTSIEIVDLSTTKLTVPEINDETSWDVSEAGDGSVIAWAVNDPENDGKYKIYIGGDGGVIANEDSTSLFAAFAKLKTINIDKLDTSNVTNMSGMFSGTSLETLDLSNFDTSKVTDMSYMFSGCSNLTVLDLSGFNTENVNNMEEMFSGSKKLTIIYVSDKFVTTKVSNSENMFYYSWKLIGQNGTTNDGSNIDVTYARVDTAETPGYFTDYSIMLSPESQPEYITKTDGVEVKVTFNDSKGLEANQKVYYAWSKSNTIVPEFTSYVTTTNKKGDTRTTVTIPASSSKNLVGENYLWIKEGTVSNIDGKKSKQRVSRVFKLDNGKPVMSNFEIESEYSKNVTSVEVLDSINIPDNAIKTWDKSSWEIGQKNRVIAYIVNDPEEEGKYKYYIAGNGTVIATDLYKAFQYWHSLKTVDLSKLDTSNVTNMVDMFGQCYNITAIYVSDKFVTTNVTNSNYMFFSCYELVGGSGTVYSDSKVGVTYARIDTPSTPGYFTDINAPKIQSVSTTSTIDTINVVVSANDNNNTITKYEYSIDNGTTWNESSNNTYSFTGLNANTTYTIRVRVISTKASDSTTVYAITSGLQLPNFTQTDNNVTIEYLYGCGSTYTCSYIKDNGEEQTFTQVDFVNTTQVEFSGSGLHTLVAKISDGKTIITRSYSFQID